MYIYIYTLYTNLKFLLQHTVHRCTYIHEFQKGSVNRDRWEVACRRIIIVSIVPSMGKKNQESDQHNFGKPLHRNLYIYS